MPSLKLLEYLVHELSDSRILLIGTYRDVESRPALSITLGDIGRVRQFERITLSGLSKSEVYQLIQLLAGKPSSKLADSIHVRTEGNPLFAQEIVRYLDKDGRLAAGSDDWTLDVKIPEGVREVIGRRLDRLSEKCIRLLKIASIAGREFGLSLMRRMGDDLGEDNFAGLLGEAMAIGVVEDLTGVGRYQFSHKLVQETLKESLTAFERMELHARAAKALEEEYSDTVEEHAAELAAHLAEAHGLLGTDLLVHYSLLAGKQASDRGASEEALRIYSRAIHASQNQSMDEKLAELYAGCANAQLLSGEGDEGVATGTRLFNYYEQTENIAGLTQTLGILQCLSPFLSNQIEFSLPDCYRRSIALYEKKLEKDPHILTTMSHVRFSVDDDFKMAEGMLRDALVIARDRGDKALQWQVLMRWAYLEQTTGRSYSSVKRHELALSVRPEHANAYLDWAFYDEFIAANQTAGNLDEAEKHAACQEKASDALGLPRFKSTSRLKRQVISINRGNWQRARSCFHEGMRILERWDYFSPDKLWLLAYAAITEYEVGDFQLGQEYLTRFLEYRVGPESKKFCNNIICNTLIFPKLARILESERWFDLSDDASKLMLSNTVWKWPLIANIGLVASLRGDREAAGRWYEELLRRRGEIGGYLGHTLGVIAHASGRLEDAVAHFEQGYVFTGNAGFLPNQAWICHDYAEALFERKGNEDLTRAKLLLEEGLAIAERLAMVPLQKKTAALYKTVSTAAPKYPAGLTRREAEVITFVAKGMTNKEIGDKLCISGRTVAAHLRRIFDKVGAANRAEVAAYAMHHAIQVNSEK